MFGNWGKHRKLGNTGFPWPLKSPDLISANFWLHGYSKLFDIDTVSYNLPEVKYMIQRELSCVSYVHLDLLHSTGFMNRLKRVIPGGGGNTDHVQL